jgi:hypothetical protein
VVQAREITLLRSARCLALDLAVSDVSGALADAGVDSMLIKGAATARLLYRDGAPRHYSDGDLLVRRADVAQAEAVLERQGFGRAYDEESCVPADQLHAHLWLRRRDRAGIDLHWTLMGVGASPDATFDELWSEAGREHIGGRELAVPSPGATVLLATFQLLAHGREHGAKRRVDVERALTHMDLETWHDAARIARSLDGAATFGAGLRLATGGHEMAERLGLPDDKLARNLADQSSGIYAARWFDRVASAPGLRGKVRLLLWLVFPPRSYLVFVHPSARRGGLRLALIYALRPLRLLARAPGVIATWRRAHREAHG